MSDLSVFDVQNALREHARHGHDILTDPRIVHLGEPTDPSKPFMPFGLPLRHGLVLYKNENNTHYKDYSVLTSDLMHGEQPTGTSIASAVGRDRAKNESGLIFRLANKMHPRVDEEGHGFAYSFGENDVYHHYGDVFDEHSHPSLHTVLKAQATTPAKYISNGSDGDDHNTIGWDLHEALKNRAHPLEPFSGLVEVRHQDDQYLYSPKTEQLHKLS